MSGYKSESELLQAISSLPREVTPSNDVWPRIARRLEGASGTVATPVTKNHWWPAAIAASFLLVLMAGLILRQPSGSGSLNVEFAHRPSETTQAATTGTGFPARRLLTGAITLEEQEYQAAFREFLSVMPDLQSTYRPGMETIESGWDVLQRAESELAAALRQEPQSRFLNSRMAALRARQLDLLQQIAAMEMQSRRSTT